jgi:hypothetical protein
MTFDDEQEHVFLVAFTVHGQTRDQAQDRLMAQLVPVLRGHNPTSPVESWWVAEDDRRDGSDCDSAVFVPYSPDLPTGQPVMDPLRHRRSLLGLLRRR